MFYHLTETVMLLKYQRKQIICNEKGKNTEKTRRLFADVISQS
jgi:hypothetical protein